MSRCSNCPLARGVTSVSSLALFAALSAACSSAEKKDDPAPTSTEKASEESSGGGEASAAGPIDGTWAEASLTCDGEPNPKIPMITLAVQGDTGTFTLGFGPTCSALIPEGYSYAGDVVSITPASVSCSPNEGCGDVFGGADCLPGPPPPTDFTFSVDGDQLTLKKTSGGPPADNCPAGTEEVYVMQRQG